MQSSPETDGTFDVSISLRREFGDLEDFEGLPTPPTVANEIIELLKDPDADFKLLIDSIMKDPALVAKILKTANSAIFSRRREVTNLAQALLTMGQVATATLALSFTLVNGMQSANAGSLDLTVFWRRSLVAAVAARLLGKSVDGGNAEELYLSALLQDIGMMVIDIKHPEFYAEVSDHRSHEQLLAAERQALGFDHAELGAWLLKLWDLPTPIYLPVRYSHHDVEASDQGQCSQIANSCVSVSSRIAELMTGNAEERDIALIAADAERLGISREATSALLDEISEQIPVLESQFEIPIIDETDKLGIIKKAHEVLMDVNLRTLQEIATLQRNAENLQREKDCDGLTGLKNREFLDRELRQWVTQANKHEFSLCVVFMDLDGFKQVNDQYGHAAGDKILKLTSDLLTDQVRTTDLLARFGGDEFVLVLGGEKVDDALIVCRRILNAFSKTTFKFEGQEAKVGMSIGLAERSMVKEPTDTELLRIADLAMLEAKRNGKNQVVVYSPAAND